MATPTRFLSKCPVTFAGNESEEVELKDFAAFRNIKSDAVKKKQMERFRFVNSVIPLFIPPEHHTMWYFQNSSGSFWGDATHFLLCSKAHGFQLWKKFEEELRSMDAETSCRPHISASMTNRILQHTESGEDGFFALHDLVLLQLPFQPILLFQWLALSFCALMDFEHQMALLYGLPIPVKFKPHVLYLDKLMRSAQLNLGFLFDYLQRQIESEHDVFVGNLRAFELFLNEVIVFLRFQLCENGVEYAKDLVNKCWRNNWRPSKGKHFRLKKIENPLRNRNFLFNMNFWRGPRPGLKIFGSSDEQLLANDVILDKPSREEIIETLHFDFIPKVNDTILKGIDVNVLIKEQGFLKRIRKLNQAGTLLALAELKPEEKGVLGTVLQMSASTNQTYELYEVASWIIKAYDKAPADVITFNDPLDGATADDIETKIAEIRALSCKGHMNELRRTLSGNDELLHDFGSDWTNPEILEIRIQNIVLKCIAAHREIKHYEREKDDVMRDWQVVQYLLPCFAASYRFLWDSKNPEEEPVQQWYAKFLDELIKTYEAPEGVRKSSWPNILNDIDSSPELSDSYHNKNHQKLLGLFKEVSKEFIINISGSRTTTSHLKYCGYFQALFEVMQRCSSESKLGALNDDIASEPSVYWNWLLWDLFGRMKRVMRTVSQNLKSIDASTAGALAQEIRS